MGFNRRCLPGWTAQPGQVRRSHALCGYGGGVTEPRSAGTRLCHALLLGVLSVGLGLGAHLVSGGERPTLVTLWQSTAAISVLALLIVRRRPSVTAAATMLAGTQLLLHQWFALSTPGACAGHLAERYLPGMHLLPDQLVPWGFLAETAQACATSSHPGVGLLAVAGAAHAVAALLSTLAATHGQVLLLAAAALLPRPLPARGVLLLARPNAAPSPRTPRITAEPLTTIVRRGPPAAALAG